MGVDQAPGDAPQSWGWGWGNKNHHWTAKMHPEAQSAHLPSLIYLFIYSFHTFLRIHSDPVSGAALGAGNTMGNEPDEAPALPVSAGRSGSRAVHKGPSVVLVADDRWWGSWVQDAFGGRVLRTWGAGRNRGQCLAFERPAQLGG